MFGQLSVDPSGQYLYAMLPNSSQVAGFRIDATTGGLTPLTGSPFNFAGSQYPSAMAFDPGGAHAYLANYYYRTVSVLQVNQGTGVTHSHRHAAIHRRSVCGDGHG